MSEHHMSDGFFLPASVRDALLDYLGGKPHREVRGAILVLEQLQPGQPLEPQESEEEQDA